LEGEIGNAIQRSLKFGQENSGEIEEAGKFFGNIPPISFGLNFEKLLTEIAKAIFSKIIDVASMQECSMILSQKLLGFGTAPDAIFVDSNGDIVPLEVKCIFSRIL
jgi:hypothetical protein